MLVSFWTIRSFKLVVPHEWPRGYLTRNVDLAKDLFGSSEQPRLLEAIVNLEADPPLLHLLAREVMQTLSPERWHLEQQPSSSTRSAERLLDLSGQKVNMLNGPS